MDTIKLSAYRSIGGVLNQTARFGVGSCLIQTAVYLTEEGSIYQSIAYPIGLSSRIILHTPNIFYPDILWRVWVGVRGLMRVF